MGKEKRNILLGIILLIFTLNFVFTNKGILLSDLSRNGGTILNFEVNKNINVDEVKTNISKSTNINFKNINIENNNGDLRIKLGLLKPEEVDIAEKSLVNEFGSDIKMTSSSIIEKPDKSVVLYIVYLLIIISFLLSVYIISKNIISILSFKEKMK
ncbi:MAG: hypothetical protein ACQEQE_05710 [Bacillota bacterium]